MCGKAQKGGWLQTRGILDAQCRVTWQSEGWKDSGRQTRDPRHSMSSDVAVRRAVADQGRCPRCLTLWCGKVKGARVMANGGRCPQRSMSSDVAERGAGADQERHSWCLMSSDVAQWRVRVGDGGGRWRLAALVVVVVWGKRLKLMCWRLDVGVWNDFVQFRWRLARENSRTWCLKTVHLIHFSLDFCERMVEY